YHKHFQVALNCTHCMNIIYNTVPLSLHNEWGKWKELTNMRLDFTIEDASQTREILSYFGTLLLTDSSTKVAPPPYQEYTTGHEKRGVE
ncbi:MAG: U32 family peptidase, partial [Lachnospiraceae bacterium]|nr:U32 family peptidase [Lachnospiraceae bacterium]